MFFIGFVIDGSVVLINLAVMETVPDSLSGSALGLATFSSQLGKTIDILMEDSGYVIYSSILQWDGPLVLDMPLVTFSKAMGGHSCIKVLQYCA